MNASDVNKDLPIDQFLMDAWERYWKNYRAELKRCRAEFSNEAVHDLRTSTRRMLAFIQLLGYVSPRPRLQKLTHAFKEQLDDFDELRDTQVILAEVSETVQEFPQLTDFHTGLLEAEQRLLKTLRKKLKVIDLFDVSKRIRRMRESLKDETGNHLLPATLQAVDDAFLAAKQRRDWINPSAATTIHRVRIAFKSFRYMVEIIHPLLNDFPSENLKQMHEYQSLMGEIQDIEIIMQALAEAPIHLSRSEAEPVRGHYMRCHADAISACMAAIDQLDRFWRAAPDQSFPWEK